MKYPISYDLRCPALRAGEIAVITGKPHIYRSGRGKWCVANSHNGADVNVSREAYLAACRYLTRTGR